LAEFYQSDISRRGLEVKRGKAAEIESEGSGNESAPRRTMEELKSMANAEHSA